MPLSCRLGQIFTSKGFIKLSSTQLQHLVKVRSSSPGLCPKPSPSQTSAIYSYHTPSSLPAQHSNLFFQKVILLLLTYLVTTHRLFNTYPLSNPIIPHSFNMAKPSENTFVKTFNHSKFVIPHICLICTYGTLSILIIPNIPLRLSIYTVIILGLSFSLYITASLS